MPEHEPCEHHFIPRQRGKTKGGEPVYVQVCKHCGKTLSEVQAEAPHRG